jgi:hypothetical protein
LSNRIHRSLRRKTKTQIEALRTRTIPSSSSHSSKYASFIRSKPQNQTHTKQQTETKDRHTANAQVQYFISAAERTGFPTQQQQRQSIQFYSTKLNQFSPSFNAQLSPACNSHTLNQQSQLKPHTRKQSSTKFTIKLVGVLIFSVATHAKQSASHTEQQKKQMNEYSRTHGQPTVSAKAGATQTAQHKMRQL